MSRIMVLEDSMIDKIAAGEVVERPGSVVKELVENSIDSGAREITIEIKDGGISLIRVTDDGEGIPELDVLSAFVRHATSKIRDINDLENVLTLGFRGEALSSIASVSQIEMITKPKTQIAAKRVELHGGKLVSESMVGSADGTSIMMRNLFFNVPARRKFIKKPSIESGYVSDIVNRIILGHPEIAFNYIVNNSQMIHTNGSGDVKNAIFAVYGRDIAKGVIYISEETGSLRLTGYIGKPEISRGNRSYGSIFINGRYIKSRIIEQAIEDAYKTKIMGGKFPVYVLNLHVEPSSVDVNVHPQKMEVRFGEENLIYEIFYNAVTKALKNTVLIPEINISGEINKRNDSFASQRTTNGSEQLPIKADADFKSKPGTDTTNKSNTYSVNMDNLVSSLFEKKEKENTNSYAVINEALVAGEYVAESLNIASKKAENSKSFFKDYRIAGQIFNTYWIVEQDSTIFLIDQHAAHERAIFEKLLLGFKKKNIISQNLIEPVILNLSNKEAGVLEDNLELFSRFGYKIESFGLGEYALSSVPYIIGGAANISLFSDILDKITENAGSISSIYDEKIDAIAMISCKAAVKANDRLSQEEAKKLIEDVLKLEDPFTCPHGRPTIIKLTKYEIEKMFKRIV